MALPEEARQMSIWVHIRPDEEEREQEDDRDDIDAHEGPQTSIRCDHFFLAQDVGQCEVAFGHDVSESSSEVKKNEEDENGDEPVSEKRGGDGE